MVNTGVPASGYSTIEIQDEYIFLRNPEDDRTLTVYNRLPSAFGRDSYLLTNPELDAAHSLALAGLRRLGYRPRNRYVVFQTLTHTLSIPAATWRVLARAHDLRNLIEYEGSMELDERLLEDMIAAARAVLVALRT